MSESKRVCTNDCTHKHCARVRVAADDKCVLCHHEIGFDTPFFQMDRGPIHATCANTESLRCAA